MSHALSRRSFLTAAGAAMLLVRLGGSTQAASAHALPAADVTTDPSPGLVPDPVAYSGSWTRTGDGGQQVVTGADANALALSEAEVGANGVLTAAATVDASTPYGVAALAARVAEDGTGGYAASLDPNLGQVRLFDLATGRDLVPPAPFGSTAGTTHRLQLSLDGPDLRFAVDGSTLLTATDHAYGLGRVGLHGYNGTVTFGPATLDVVTTNLSGWQFTGGGTWTPTTVGWHANAPANTNIRALAATSAFDLALGTDVLVHDTYAVPALLLRTDAAGSRGYGVQVDPNLGRLRLYRIDGDATLGSHSTTITLGAAYRLRIEAEGSQLRVYWQTDFIQPDGYAPVITATDTAWSSGQVGAQVYNGSASFENIAVSDVVTDLQGWTDDSGAWAPDLLGLRGDATAGPALHTAPFVGTDAITSVDLALSGTATPSALGVVLGGCVVQLAVAANQLQLVDRATGAVIAAEPAPVRAIAPGSAYRLEVHLLGGTLTAWLDGVNTLTATTTAGSLGRVGLTVTGGVGYAQNIRFRTPQQWFTEPYRPGYHYSELAEYTSDPNGLVHHAGEYHLFHQDQGRWAHAVSTDLCTWRALPIALPFSVFGQAWSGSALVDTANTSGLFPGGSGLLAYYTAYNPDRSNGNQCVRIAYSTDRGRSWQLHGTDPATPPAVPNPGGPDGDWAFRDPKVVRDDAHGQWVMVVSGGDHVRFFTSTDLLTWAFASAFGYGAWVTGGTWECPDFLLLPVTGSATDTRWVLNFSTGPDTRTDGSTSQYLTGQWDGTTFTPDTPAGTVLRTDHGRDYYAAVTWSDAPNGQPLQIGWLSDWDYPFSAPTGAWRGALSVPRELALVHTDAGYRLTTAPAPQLTGLRGTVTTVTGPVTLTPDGANPLAQLSGVSYELRADFSLPGSGGADEFGFLLRTGNGQQTAVGYDTAAGALFVDRTRSGRSDFTAGFADRSQAPYGLTAGKLSLRVLVDNCSVEAFTDDGLAAVTSLVLPDLDATGLAAYATGGAVTLDALSFWPLATPMRHAPAVTPPALPSGGQFRSTGLGAFTVTPGGTWTPSGAGEAGTFDLDSLAVFAGTFADVDFRATVRLGGPDGVVGAGALLLRCSADGADGYYVNLDADLRAVRLLAKVNGSFDPVTGVLADQPVLLRHGAGYPVRVLAQGSRIQVWLDGSAVVDVTDTRYASGQLGFDVFGGRAAFQDASAVVPTSPSGA